jgi:putative ABC transport system ATP-binding protein
VHGIETATSGGGPAPHVIRLSDVSFRYAEGDFVLRLPGLLVERGETVAFVGPSGSGKTTLLNLIAGIAVAQRGRIETNGVELTELSDEARRSFRITNIGLIFQEFELLEYLSVLDNILLPYRINASLRLDGTVRDRARALAERVGIADKLGRHPERLSQGERQRVAVCRAVLPAPALLLADEPTGNLDPVNAERVMEILLDFVRRGEATLVTVTHDRDLLRRFGRVVDFKSFGETVAASGDRPAVGAADGAGPS